jgi:hypothetical protein
MPINAELTKPHRAPEQSVHISHVVVADALPFLRGKSLLCQKASIPILSPVDKLALSCYERSKELQMLNSNMAFSAQWQWLADGSDADEKSPTAQTALAALLWNGIGVSTDRITAAHYFGFAAEQGVAEAQYRYAIALLIDVGHQDTAGSPDGQFAIACIV